MSTKPAILNLFMMLASRYHSVRRATLMVYFDQPQTFKARRSCLINESEPFDASGGRAQTMSAFLPAGDPFASATAPRSERIPMCLSQELYRV
jgi:hypothetical protein